MRINKGKKFRCTNHGCDREFEVLVPPNIEGQTNPRCVCGSEMKKPYAKPVARRLGGDEAQRAKDLFSRKRHAGSF